MVLAILDPHASAQSSALDISNALKEVCFGWKLLEISAKGSPTEAILVTPMLLRRSINVWALMYCHMMRFKVSDDGLVLLHARTAVLDILLV